MAAQNSKGTTGKKSPPLRLSRERRHVLQLLVSAGHRGVTEAIVMAHGFSSATLAGMASDGIIAVATDTVRAGDRMITVRRLRITDAGRKALAG